ncbi:MAG: serine/threonine-protein kinase [Candidatus Melainabacteria bacterium]|nr:serine/threonine-protein kinase [Candidatus Melainabacteria bacterium]
MSSAVWERLEEVRAGAALNPDPLIGSTLFERYVITDLLGSGGMAKVFKALEISNERVVAIKTLRTSDEQAVGRFANEILMLSKLTHPNIVNSIDCFYEAGKIYFVMEYLHGMTLQELINNGKHLSSAEDVISIVGQLCDGLSHAHKAGIIHRDLKPANIMLVDEGNGVRVKIVDFGIAKFEAELQQVTQAGIVVGTPMYMSPEQCMGEKVDERSDVYSLGALLYELLTGSVPYPNASVQHTMFAHCDSLRYPEPIESRVEFWPYAKQLNRIVQFSMETSREVRYQTVQQFKKQLQIWYRCVNEGVEDNQIDILEPLSGGTSLDAAPSTMRKGVTTTIQAWAVKERVG